jgi:hypothetical protein
MKKLLIASAIAAVTTSAMAEESAPTNSVALTGGVAVEVAENTADEAVATNTINLGVDATVEGSFANFVLETVDGGDIVVDEWQIGTTVGDATVSYGDQGDFFPGAGLEVVGDDTLADPAEFDSLMVQTGGLGVMVALTDATTDMGDVESVQVAYTVEAGALTATGVVDHNVDTEVNTVGVSATLAVSEAVSTGIVVTNDETTTAYEANVALAGVTAFVNGDENDMSQNVGAGYAVNYNGLDLYAEVAYNFDSEDVTPAAGIALNF